MRLVNMRGPLTAYELLGQLIDRGSHPESTGLLGAWAISDRRSQEGYSDE